MMFQGVFSAPFDVVLRFSEYQNGRIYIGGDDPEEGPAFDATINLPEQHIRLDEAFIKNYGENEGVLEFLMDNDIVLEVVRLVSTGFVLIPLCKLNMKKINELTNNRFPQPEPIVADTPIIE